MMQNLIVALIVIGAALYTLRKYLPTSVRQKLVHALRRRGATGSNVAAWLDTTSTCGGGCDSCKSCETPAEDIPAAPREHVIKIVRR